MGRAPNSGAPQRVSAHVVPKARPASSSFLPVQVPEDEEKTTIDSGWGDEASTTVEQGELGERLRSFGSDAARNNITHTTATGGVIEEPTVDERRGSLALIAAPAPPARLVITGGKDRGRELVLEPAKTYTIGRAIDNDLVLTDIAVSRKHFDLRSVEGAWVIVDRGSGNGTLVNGGIEDQPLALVSGDTVEIGNTIFRFDQASADTRPAPTVELSIDQAPIDPAPIDATPIAPSHGHSFGQSLGDDDEESTIAGKPVRTQEVQLLTPAPQPPRARPRTMPPPLRPRPASMPPPPMAAVAPSGPVPGHPAPPPPARLPPVGVATAASSAQFGSGPVSAPHMSASGPVMLTDPRASSQRMSGPLPAAPYGYPPVGDLPPQHAPSGPLMVSAGPAGRDATSTALVPPAPYAGMPAHLAQPYRAAVLSRRAKLLLGGAALTLFAAISTVAVIKGTSDKPPGADPMLASTAAAATPAEPRNPRATVSPISEAIQGKPVLPAEPAAPAAPATPAAEPAAAAPAPEPAPEPASPTPAIEIAAAEQPREPTPREEPARPKVVAKQEPARPKVVAKQEPAKPKVVAKQEPTRRSAAADTDSVRAKASRLYRDKSFSSAAKVLRDAAASAGGKEASRLKSLAGTYEAFGKAFNLGMAPNTPAKQAWDALARASTYDRSAGSAFASEIRTRMGQVAPKAAAAFMASRDYVKARRAVTLAESTGNGNSTTSGVRQSLEQAAGQLYRQAQAEMSSDSAAAKTKLKTIQNMVDAKSPWHERAGKLLSSR